MPSLVRPPRRHWGIVLRIYGIGKTGGYLSSRVSSLTIAWRTWSSFFMRTETVLQACNTRSMIPAPESFSNFMQRGFGVAPSQIHRHLARECDIRGAPFTGHIRESNIKLFGHLLLNLIDGHRLFGFFPQNIPKKSFYRFAGNLSATQ